MQQCYFECMPIVSQDEWTDLHSSWSTRQRHKSAGRFVAHSRTLGIQEVVDASDEPRPLWRISVTNLANINT